MAGKTIEVLVPVSGAGYSYALGVHKNVPKEIADDLIKAGHAKVPGNSAKPKQTTAKPASKGVETRDTKK